MRTDDDDWFDKVQTLNERFDGQDPDENIRRIARQEANKRIEAYLGPIAWIVGCWWASREYGPAGLWIVVGIGIAWFAWTVIRTDWDPEHERDLIVDAAEDLNRLGVITDAYNAGEQVWHVEEKKYDGDTRKVVVLLGQRWDGSWRRVHGWALKLEVMTPRQRRKTLLDAAKTARAPLNQGADLAKREQAAFALWAENYLREIKKSNTLNI